MRVEASQRGLSLVMEDENGSLRTDRSGNGVDEKEGQSKKEDAHLESCRVEIDTSPPFESVMEAVFMFEQAVRKSQEKISTHRMASDSVDDELTRVEAETLRLEKDLIMKEKETLDVLKELDKAKRVVEELKSKLQKGTSEDCATPISSASSVIPVCGRGEMSPREDLSCFHGGTVTEFMDSKDPPTDTRENDIHHLVDPLERTLAAASCELHKNTDATITSAEILTQLRQAKLNLSRATGSLCGVRASIKSLDSQLSAEKCSLAQTRERLNSKYISIASMEEKLKETLAQLQSLKDAETRGYSEKVDISKALGDLHNEADLYQKMTEDARSEVMRIMIDTEETKSSINKTAEIRCRGGVKKMEDATQASELSLLSEKETLEESENAETDSSIHTQQQHPAFKLSHEEYNALAQSAKTAENDAKRRIEEAMHNVDAANASKLAVFKELQRAAEDVKVCRDALRKALIKVENANNAKLAVEESLRRWRTQHSQHRRSVHNTMKFKNPYPMHRRQRSRNSIVVDVNGVDLVGDESNRVLKPILSIGQILSRKLKSVDSSGIDLESDEPQFSLAQMLERRNEVTTHQTCGRSHDDDKKLLCKEEETKSATFFNAFSKREETEAEVLSIRRCLRGSSTSKKVVGPLILFIRCS